MCPHRLSSSPLCRNPVDRCARCVEHNTNVALALSSRLALLRESLSPRSRAIHRRLFHLVVRKLDAAQITSPNMRPRSRKSPPFWRTFTFKMLRLTNARSTECASWRCCPKRSGPGRSRFPETLEPHCRPYGSHESTEPRRRRLGRACHRNSRCN